MGSWLAKQHNVLVSSLFSGWFCKQYWTSPGDNTPQGTNYTVTCLPSRKLSKLDEPDMQDTAGEAGTSSLVMYSYGPPHMAGQKQVEQLEHTYSSYVRIWDVALKTCQRRWTIGRSGERGSGISVLAARHDDDDFGVKHSWWQMVNLDQCQVENLSYWQNHCSENSNCYKLFW